MDDNAKNTDNVTSADKPKKNNYNRNKNYYRNNKSGSGDISGGSDRHGKQGYNKSYNGGNRKNSGNAEKNVSENNRSNGNKGNSQNRNRNKNYKNGGNQGVSKPKGYYMTKTTTDDEDFDEIFKDVFGNDDVEENIVNDSFSSVEENEPTVKEVRKNQSDRPKKKKKPSVKVNDDFSEVTKTEEVIGFDFTSEEDDKPTVKEVRKNQSDRPKKKKKPSVKLNDDFSEVAETEEVIGFDFTSEEDDKPTVKEVRKNQSNRPKKKKKPSVKVDNDFSEVAETEEVIGFNFTSEEEYKPTVKEVRKNQSDRPKKKKKPSVKVDDDFSEVAETEEVIGFNFTSEEEDKPTVKEVRKNQSDRPKKKKKPSVKVDDDFSEVAETEEVIGFNFTSEEEDKPTVKEVRKNQSDRPKKKKKPSVKVDNDFLYVAETKQHTENVEKTVRKSSKLSADENFPQKDNTKKEEQNFTENKKKSETRFWSRMFSLGVIVPVYAALVICMAFLPRSTVSNIEKRSLSTFPEFSWSDYWNGTYTSGITHYFDDTVPFRDTLKQAGSQLMNLFGIQYNNVQVTGQMQVVNDKNSDKQDSSDNITNSDSKVKTSSQSSDTDTEEDTSPKGQEIADGVYTNGTIVVYQDGHYRSMAMYGGGTGDVYVDSVNKIAADLPGVKVYSMVDPTSSEFYTPLNFSDYNASQSDDIESINSRLQNVKGINVCSTLAKHVDETIYTRTDHHWMSLGAYYAAQRFAEEAGVSFRDIGQYSKKKTPGYVGTMYSFSGNNANLLNDPEDFIYYVPKTKDYTVEYYDYAYNFVFEGDLMVEAYDISEMYSSYIGGDGYTVKISTGVKNGRKLCLVKDSYGNALPQFWIGSFEEIYVIDMRYFELNLIDFIKDNKITDLLFSCCSYSAVGPNAENLEYLRTMGIMSDTSQDNDDKTDSDENTDDISSNEVKTEDSNVFDDTAVNSDIGNNMSSEEEDDDFFDNINIDDGQIGLIGNINQYNDDNDDIFGVDDIIEEDDELYFDDDYGYDEDY